MRRARLAPIAMSIVLCGVLVVAVGPVAASSLAPPTPAAVAAGFRKATGRTLTVDRLRSRPGVYTAYTVSDSVTNRSLFGQFTLYVVTSGDPADTAGLLVSTRTGELGTPGPSKIYWEPGRYLSGTPYFLGRKQYGTSVVLWWYGEKQKIDTRFKRLHKALLPFASS